MIAKARRCVPLLAAALGAAVLAASAAGAEPKKEAGEPLPLAPKHTGGGDSQSPYVHHVI
jgi:Spy/CpxP family protein refolding chaperone